MTMSLPILSGTPRASPRFVAPDTFKSQQYRFHSMIKPSGAACNMDCPYCFYLHKTDLLGQPQSSRMADETLEEHVRQYIEAQNAPEVVFSWQGGEPTLMGLAFFRKVVELQAKLRKPFQRIENDLQTNGLLINEEWAAFLKKHNFVVGLSIDGPREIHDKYRFTKGGQSTFDRVIDAARLLKSRGVRFNVLCVVNRDNARRPLSTYRFLRSLGAGVIQFTPCVETDTFKSAAPALLDDDRFADFGGSAARPGNSDSLVTEWSVDPHDWGDFLCAVWNEWFRKDIGRVFVNLFENVIAQSMGHPAQMCTHAEFCGKGLAVEHNGDVYSCDHFVYPQFKLGNIHEKHQAEMAYSQTQKDFGFAKRDTLPQYCKECEHLKLCWGECPKNRIIKTPDGKTGLNYLCAGWKKFYAHIRNDMRQIAGNLGGTLN
jgi:uncharacterized protein